MDCIWLYNYVKAIQIGGRIVTTKETEVYWHGAKISGTLNPTYTYPLKESV